MDSLKNNRIQPVSTPPTLQEQTDLLRAYTYRKIKRYFATAAWTTQRVCNGKAAYPAGFRSIFESIILLVQ